MKFVSFLILSVFLFTYGTAQDNTFNDSRFPVSSIRLPKANTLQEKAGLFFEFDIQLPANEQGAESHKYIISPVLTKDGIPVVTAENMPEKTFFSKNEDEIDSRNAEFIIPYTEIDLLPGQHQCRLQIHIKDDFEDFGIIYETPVLFDMPQLYDYSEQRFEIERFTVKENKTAYNLPGQQAAFSCSFKFPAEHIRGIFEDESLKDYRFRIELYEESDSEPIAFFKPWEFEMTARDEKHEAETFTAAHNLWLAPGKHRIRAKLYALLSEQAGDTVLLGETVYSLEQLQIYFGEFALNYYRATYRQYDTPTAIGRIFSKPSKNKGKGYPDTYWKFTAGDLALFCSDRYKNSFNAPPDSFRFSLSDLDPLAVSVWDFDALNRNDQIDFIPIQQSAGPFDKKTVQYSSSSTENMEYTFAKYTIPFPRMKSLKAIPVQRAGVSGLEIHYRLDGNAENINEAYDLTPVVGTYEDYAPPAFYEIDKPEALHLSGKQAESKAVIFIPFLYIPANAFFGMELRSEENAYSLPPVWYKQALKLPNLASDIIFKISEIKEDRYMGMQGLKIDTEFRLPMWYAQRLAPSDFLSEIICRSINQDQKQADLIPLNTVPEIQSDSVWKYQFFLPFRSMHSQGDGILKFRFTASMRPNESGIFLCHDSIDFSAPSPKLISTDKTLTISLKTKLPDDIQKLWIEIRSSNEVCFRSDVQSVNKEEFKIEGRPLFVHPKDDLELLIYGKDEYDLEELLFSKSYLAETLLSKQFRKKGNRTIKKISISR